MKLITVFFCAVFLLVAVNGRHLHETDSEQENVEESLTETRDSLSRPRHRRRSRQQYFDYNYSPYHEYRRDNSRQDEIYSEIMKLIDEMSEIIKRPQAPPPPPHPIYIPYPVPYPVPQYLPCRFNKPKNGTAGGIPNFGVRWPEMEDELQAWGLIPGDVGAEDDSSEDGSRPISFNPIVPDGPVKESPPVEHGSVQAGMETTTAASPRKPGVCQAAILTCCNSNNKSERQSCFEKYGCSKTFSTGLSCRPEVVKAVLEEFVKVYAPTNEP